MEELQWGQNLLREEVDQLKRHMGLAMETLQALLRSDGNPILIAIAEIVTSFHPMLL